jgi:hypothetical protein
MRRSLLSLASTAVALWAGVAVSVSAAGGQATKTQALAQELTTLLQSQKKDSIAARLGDDEFVAALYYPGTELLVVSAKYSAPTLLYEKIVSKNYRDAYMDLATASVADSKLLVEDLKGDGIRPTRVGSEPFDIVTKGTSPPVNFDGDWKKRKLSPEEYQKAFTDAETAYARLLTALVAELKK